MTAFVSALVLAVGCQDTRPSNDSGITVLDGSIFTVDAGPPVPTENCPTSVDLLLMVDSSHSMIEEQNNLAVELPLIVERVGEALPGRDLIESLHLGVITADMGTAGFGVPTCDDPTNGDDGVLRTIGRTDIPGCQATYPSFLEFAPGGGVTAADIASDLQCVALVGTRGCGFEQPLEATYAALTRHADGANAGFLRPDSLLTTVLLTDEEDCSAADGDLFNLSSDVYTTDLNLRCPTYPEALHPTSRYVDGLLGTRIVPEDLLFGLVAGVPLNLEDATYSTILSDPRMQEELDPAMPTRLVPSCNEPGTGLAFPPRRMVETARDLDARGATVVLGSICNDSLRNWAALLAQAVTERLSCRD